MHNFLYQNICIFPLHALFTRKINILWSKSIDQFLSGGIGTFWVQNIIQDKSTKFTKSFKIYIIFFPKCLDTPKSYKTDALKAYLSLTYAFDWLDFTLYLTAFSSINYLLHRCVWFEILFHLREIRFCCVCLWRL